MPLPPSTLPLSPHNLPPELLGAIISYLPDGLSPLLCVNSSFYLAAKPHLFRKIRLVERNHQLELAGPDHTLGDRNAATSSPDSSPTPPSFGSRRIPRPIFRNNWLCLTHTLEVGAHSFKACEAFHRAPHELALPRLRVLRILFDAHGECPAQSDADAERQCAFLAHSFHTLVHDAVPLWSSPAPQLHPPPGFHVKHHVLLMDASNPPMRSEVFDDDDSWLNTPQYSPWLGFRKPKPVGSSQSVDGDEVDEMLLVSDHVVVILPVIPGDVQAMLGALQDIVVQCLWPPDRTLLVVGGVMDPRSGTGDRKHRAAGGITAFDEGDDSQGEGGDNEIDDDDSGFDTPPDLDPRELLLLMLPQVFQALIEHAEGKTLPPDGTEREMTIAERVASHVNCIAFSSLDDLLATRKLEHLFTSAEITRVVRGDMTPVSKL